MSAIQKKITRHTKKQKTIEATEQPSRSESYMTGMLELSYQKFKKKL